MPHAATTTPAPEPLSPQSQGAQGNARAKMLTQPPAEGFLGKFGALLIAQWGATEALAHRDDSRPWQIDAMEALKKAGDEGLATAEEALAWVFSKFPPSPRVRDETFVDHAKRLQQETPRSVGMALLRMSARSGPPGSDEKIAADFWSWIETASNFHERFSLRKGDEGEPLHTAALRANNVALAARWAERHPRGEWSSEWIPEALLHCASQRGCDSLIDDEIAKEKASRNPGLTDAARLVGALLSQERAVHGSRAKAMAVRASEAPAFLAKRSRPEKALPNLHNVEQLQWAMSLWAANGFLEASSAISWLQSFEAAGLPRNGLPTPALCAMATPSGNASGGFGPSRGFWDWLAEQKEWDGRARTQGEESLDAAQWAVANRHPALLEFLAARAPHAAIDCGWLDWRKIQGPNAQRQARSRLFATPLEDWMWAAAERHALDQASQRAPKNDAGDAIGGEGAEASASNSIDPIAASAPAIKSRRL